MKATKFNLFLILSIAIVTIFFYLDNKLLKQIAEMHQSLSKEYDRKEIKLKYFLKTIAHEDPIKTNYKIYKCDSLFNTYFNKKSIGYGDLLVLENNLSSILKFKKNGINTNGDNHQSMQVFLDQKTLKLIIRKKKYETFYLLAQNYKIDYWSYGPNYHLFRKKGNLCDSVFFGTFDNVFMYKVLYKNRVDIHFSNIFSVPKSYANSIKIETMGCRKYEQCILYQDFQ